MLEREVDVTDFGRGTFTENAVGSRTAKNRIPLAWGQIADRAKRWRVLR
jgi:hypothetical protein